MTRYYEGNHVEAAKGKFVIWIAILVPTEILKGFDVIVCAPESHSAMSAARKVGVIQCEKAESFGYSQDLCSYARCVFGSIFEDRGAFGDQGPPAPDILIATQGACTTHIKWWEALQRHFNCPLVVIDAAYTVDSEGLASHQKAYMDAQLREMAFLMEEHTGRKLDTAKLREVIALADRAGLLWDEIDDLRKAIPTPISQIDVFTCLFPLVTLRGTPEAVDFYEELRDEVKERVNKGIGFIPDERFRLVWDLFPIYHDMKLLNYFAEFGAAFVTDLYGYAFSGRLDPHDPFGSLAEKYLCFFNRSASWGKAEMYKKRVRDYSVDGIVFHSNRCCRFCTAYQREVGHILKEELGLPSLMFEADMVDPRGFDAVEVKDRIQSFIEMLEARKYPKIEKTR